MALVLPLDACLRSSTRRIRAVCGKGFDTFQNPLRDTSEFPILWIVTCMSPCGSFHAGEQVRVTLPWLEAVMHVVDLAEARSSARHLGLTGARE